MGHVQIVSVRKLVVRMAVVVVVVVVVVGGVFVGGDSAHHFDHSLQDDAGSLSLYTFDHHSGPLAVAAVVVYHHADSVRPSS